jgi:uncharacterized protein YegJ (DUF2314 family)
MKESIHNMRLICEHHRPSPNPIYNDVPLEQFQGRYCKLAFPQEDGEHFEYMWVEVVGFAESEDEELRGKLDNDPVQALQFKIGDLVEFSRNEIIEVLTEEEDN